MKIVLAGGSGQVGGILARAFCASGDDVIVLSRSPRGGDVLWDGRSDGDWIGTIDGADVVINLAGRSVNCRYNESNRRAIVESRVHSTEAIGRAIARASRPPRVWLQSSTATIYADRYDAANDESTGIIGGDEPGAPETWRFSIGVARAWEAALDAAETPHTRKVKLRSAMTMSPDRGGIFDVLLRLVRFGLGGSAGHGRQYVSWIHDADFVGAIRWLIDHDDIEGPVNICAPEPLPYRAFMQALRDAWGAPVGLAASRWMIEVGTFLARTESELVLKSRRVVPGRLLASGYRFAYPSWPEAARDLCERWRARS
jgi:uncharacterized protein (TIGR01777 family)